MAARDIEGGARRDDQGGGRRRWGQTGYKSRWTLHLCPAMPPGYKTRIEDDVDTRAVGGGFLSSFLSLANFLKIEELLEML